MSRPEQLAPPEVFYDESESKKYTQSTRVQHIQAKMTFRALELLNLSSSDHLLLDIGCGSGLSGEILLEEGYQWIGMDIAPAMVAQALNREVEGDLFLADMGSGVPFRAGTFDAAILISAIQWLCNAEGGTDPKLRLKTFFLTLYASLKRGGKFVAQFYPANDSQTEQITGAAKEAGFGGGIVVDDPESKKNRKLYLVLTAGQAEKAINLDGVTVEQLEGKKLLKKDKKAIETKKEYIQRKKELNRRRGKYAAKDSKFTGRRRRPKF